MVSVCNRSRWLWILAVVSSTVTEVTYHEGRLTKRTSAPFAKTFVVRQVTGGRWLNVAELPAGAGD